MARKLRIHIDPAQPGLFDEIEPALRRKDPLTQEPPVPDVGIADFVVRARAKNNDKERARAKETVKAADALMPIDRSTLHQPDTICFISFGSGSSGNCSYIGDKSGGILIDAGIDLKTITQRLEANGLSLDKVKGICLTHDHSDHVRFIYAIARQKPGIPVYCTPKTFNGIMRRHSVSRRLKDYHHPIYKEFPFNIGNFEITAFDVSHDGTDNCGYFISHGNRSIAIATDLGCITPRVDYYMRRANHIVIEANYDSAMLDVGPYPAYLKSRIRADYGHMDNVATARFLTDIVTPSLQSVFLCHLSQDNNTPETAFNTVASMLEAAGVTPIGDGSGSLESELAPLQLAVLPRYEPSRLYIFRK
ncbi:MAG: MBL fold metallo-hydrolase [Paramuribaculum sp.]|nr:MBL fold metallo-hydrolase [Paramuribaculum sp.]